MNCCHILYTQISHAIHPHTFTFHVSQFSSLLSDLLQRISLTLFLNLLFVSSNFSFSFFVNYTQTYVHLLIICICRTKASKLFISNKKHRYKLLSIRENIFTIYHILLISICKYHNFYLRARHSKFLQHLFSLLSSVFWKLSPPTAVT